MTLLEILAAVALVVGLAFFIAGTVGLLRFPDVYTRLHALTKADSLGLGFVVAALALEAPSAAYVGQLLLAWLLVLVASATSAHAVARSALRSGLRPWTSEEPR